MGSLAKWGAVSGLGSGMQDVAQTKKEDRQSQEKIAAEEAREMRIRKWQEGAATRAEDRKLESDKTLADYQAGIDTTVREDEQAQETSEGAARDRNRIAVAEINARGRGSSSAEWQKNRLQSKDLKVANAMGGETTVAGMFDAYTGMRYALVDGIWQAPPTMEGFGKNAQMKTSIKIPPYSPPDENSSAEDIRNYKGQMEWIDELRADRSEAMIEEFFDAHGWLPSWAFHGKAAFRSE